MTKNPDWREEDVTVCGVFTAPNADMFLFTFFALTLPRGGVARIPAAASELQL